MEISAQGGGDFTVERGRGRVRMPRATDNGQVWYRSVGSHRERVVFVVARAPGVWVSVPNLLEAKRLALPESECAAFLLASSGTDNARLALRVFASASSCGTSVGTLHHVSVAVPAEDDPGHLQLRIITAVPREGRLAGPGEVLAATDTVRGAGRGGQRQGRSKEEEEPESGA